MYGKLLVRWNRALFSLKPLWLIALENAANKLRNKFSISVARADVIETNLLDHPSCGHMQKWCSTMRSPRKHDSMNHRVHNVTVLLWNPVAPADSWWWLPQALHRSKESTRTNWRTVFKRRYVQIDGFNSNIKSIYYFWNANHSILAFE